MGAQRCVKFAKLAEGGFNRVFHLEFDNGSECIARLPYPLTGPSYLLTSSEVATLDFLSTVPKIPVPRVYAWSSRRQENPVGVDFILMEKIKGEPLSECWNKLQPLEYIALAEGIHDVEQKLASVRFSQIGSLYFPEDVSPELRTRPLLADKHNNISDSQAEKYRIGLIAEHSWWRAPRSETLGTVDLVKINLFFCLCQTWLIGFFLLGPDAKAYISAVAKSEEAVLKDDELRSKVRFRHPLMPSDPAKHLDALKLYQDLLPAAIPSAPEYVFPTLWHPDLYQQNIIVSESGPVKLSGLIDWQFATTEPYYVQANFPPAFAYLGHHIDRAASKIPQLPADFDTASVEEQTSMEEELKFARWHTCYEGRFIANDARRLAMLELPWRLRMIVVSFHALRSWSDGYFTLRKYLLDLVDGWQDFSPGTLPPVEISAALRKEIEDDTIDWMIYESCVERLCEEIGLNARSDGWVEKESFDKALEVFKKTRDADLIMQISVHGYFIRSEKIDWPFGDGGISHYLS